MTKVQKKGLQRIFNAYKYSMKGFKAGLENEAAIRQEFVLAIVLTIASVFVAKSVYDLLWLIFMPWLTVCVELLNSGIEAVVDRIGSEYHELSGRAKDLGSAAVFVMLVLTALTWLLILAKNYGLIFA